MGWWINTYFVFKQNVGVYLPIGVLGMGTGAGPTDAKPMPRSIFSIHVHNAQIITSCKRPQIATRTYVVLQVDHNAAIRGGGARGAIAPPNISVGE